MAQKTRKFEGVHYIIISVNNDCPVVFIESLWREKDMGLTKLALKIAAPAPKIESFSRYLFIGPHPDDIES